MIVRDAGRQGRDHQTLVLVRAQFSANHSRATRGAFPQTKSLRYSLLPVRNHRGQHDRRYRLPPLLKQDHDEDDDRRCQYQTIAIAHSLFHFKHLNSRFDLCSPYPLHSRISHLLIHPRRLTLELTSCKSHRGRSYSAAHDRLGFGRSPPSRSVLPTAVAQFLPRRMKAPT